MDESERPKPNSFIGEIYKCKYEEQFADHPAKDVIVERLVSGGNSVEQIDLWFAEASYYTWKKLMNGPRPKPNEDGTVTFKLYKGENNGNSGENNGNSKA